MTTNAIPFINFYKRACRLAVRRVGCPSFWLLGFLLSPVHEKKQHFFTSSTPPYSFDGREISYRNFFHLIDQLSTVQLR